MTHWQVIESNLQGLDLEELEALRDLIDQRIESFGLPNDDEGF